MGVFEKYMVALMVYVVMLIISKVLSKKLNDGEEQEDVGLLKK